MTSTTKCPHCDEVFVIRKKEPNRNFSDVMFHMFTNHPNVFYGAMK